MTLRRARLNALGVDAPDLNKGGTRRALSTPGLRGALTKREGIRLRISAQDLPKPERIVARNYQTGVHLETVRRLAIEHGRNDEAIAICILDYRHPFIGSERSRPDN